ncbi:MAG: Rrf2 family transcriptional regulator [Armatimonadetes bacterium]|nr:Rrf2 family transcriptional regulator [Armatimonadota bacterium]MDE2207083.1 Rrf2 family transcriptional regulator [Armatimonadota bacterium]
MGLFNARIRYALAAAVDLAMQPGDRPVQSRDISRRQQIPAPYLGQILSALKAAGIVRSVRGAGGGYVLAAPSDRLTVLDVVSAVTEGENLFHCDGESSSAVPGQCVNAVLKGLEEDVQQRVIEGLRSTTIAALAAKKQRGDARLTMRHGI